MDCCCPETSEPLYGAYVNNLGSMRVATQKSKFSFRTTAPASEHSHSRSRLSHSSVSDDQEHLLDEELRRLEGEYARLREEEAEIDYFEQNRIRSLEEEVAFYEQEIRERSRDIQELHQLFRVRMQERHQQQPLPLQPHPPVVMGHLPVMFMKNGDDTSISSIQPNS